MRRDNLQRTVEAINHKVGGFVVLMSENGLKTFPHNTKLYTMPRKPLKIKGIWANRQNR